VTIVIDVGCARYGADYSIERLIEEFHPYVLYGFDPAWKADMFEPPVDLQTTVHISTEAAWTHDGHVNFRAAGLSGQVTSSGPEVPCIDLARFIRELGTQDIVLKMDAEGSEYELLDHLIATGSDTFLKLAWIEWHPFGVEHPDRRRRNIEAEIACELTEWRW
jgi:FkbM family methyltransferase